MLKQDSYVSQVTEFTGNRNISTVPVVSSASRLTPPSIYAGRYTLRVAQKAKYLCRTGSIGSTKPNSAGYTSTVEHGHNPTPHTSMLTQNHSVTY